MSNIKIKMIRASGDMRIKGQKCLGAAQAKSKERMAELLKKADKDFVPGRLAFYWTYGEWSHYAYFSIDCEDDEEGVWVTDGMGLDNIKKYNRII